MVKYILHINLLLHLNYKVGGQKLTLPTLLSSNFLIKKYGHLFWMSLQNSVLGVPGFAAPYTFPSIRVMLHDEWSHDICYIEILYFYIIYTQEQDKFLHSLEWPTQLFFLLVTDITVSSISICYSSSP